MKREESLDELYRWVLNVNDALRRGSMSVCERSVIDYVTSLIAAVAEAIRDEYPFYADELPQIARMVFPLMPNGFFGFNGAAFGELFLIVKHLHCEPQDVAMWKGIHPRIAGIAKDLYLDGHYLSAADRGIVEVGDRLKEVFALLKPGVTVPSRIGDLIGALLSENGAYRFCDTSTRSGKDYRKGVQLLFEGAFAAYRNPPSHGNIAISKDDAFDRIVLASQLMKVLDDAGC